MSYILNLDDQVNWSIGVATKGNKVSQITTLQYGKGYIQRAKTTLDAVKEEWDIQLFCLDPSVWNHLDFYIRESLLTYLLWTDPITLFVEGVYNPRPWIPRDSWSLTPHAQNLIEVNLPVISYTP